MTELENTYSNSSSQDVSIDINALIDILLESKKLIISIASLFFVFAVIYSLTLPNTYKSTASMSVLEAASRTGGGGGILAGIANIGGLGLAQIGVKGPRYVNTVRSRGFFKYLTEVDKGFLPKLMAVEGYDDELKKTIFNPDVYDEVNKKWLEEKPHYLDAYLVYLGAVEIFYHQERRIIDISAVHVSPLAAKEMLDSIIFEADGLLRKFDLERSAESLQYLTTAIPNTQQLAIRGAMNDLIMNQLENQMMAKIGPNYIVNIVDPPFVPLYKFSPNRTFICVVTGLFGLVLGILFVLMRHFRHTKRKQALES